MRWLKYKHLTHKNPMKKFFVISIIARLNIGKMWYYCETSINNKHIDEGMRRHCKYCGTESRRRKDGTDDHLIRCACKLVYFCIVECQKSIWLDPWKAYNKARKRTAQFCSRNSMDAIIKFWNTDKLLGEFVNDPFKTKRIFKFKQLYWKYSLL